jgi:hypothetical protein
MSDISNSAPFDGTDGGVTPSFLSTPGYSRCSELHRQANSAAYRQPLERRAITATAFARGLLACLLTSVFMLTSLARAEPDASQQGASDPESAALSGGREVVEERALGASEGRREAQESVNALSKDIQELKTQVIALNKNLRVLEEDLLFPANTQVNVFVSLDIGKFFTLESVKLKLDDKTVASHTYSDKELSALAKGGIHKLHMANLSVGQHTLSAFFSGMGPNGREYKRGTTLKIDKELGPKYVELKISDSSMKLQPDFSVKQW